MKFSTNKVPISGKVSAYVRHRLNVTNAYIFVVSGEAQGKKADMV